MKNGLKKIAFGFGFSILIFIVGISGFVMFHPAFGSPPTKQEAKRFESSPNFDSKAQRFINQIPGALDALFNKGFSLSDIVEFLKDRPDAKPEEKLPEVRTELSAFAKNESSFSAIWLGHSSLLLNVYGTIILVDPLFSGAASPIPFFVRRFQPPVFQMEDLPDIDIVLITHDHYDHLDMKSIQFFQDKASRFVTALGVGSHLKRWGISAERITEKDWWESIDIGNTKLIATPAQHFSGRSLNDRFKTQWASWIVESNGQRVYISGDSGYSEHFKTIGKTYGPFAAAFIECGQYDDNWKEVHVSPKETVQAFEDLNARQLIPVHWGMFVLAYHSWFDPIFQLDSLAKTKNIALTTPQIGETIDLLKPSQLKKWWEPLLPTGI